VVESNGWMRNVQIGGRPADSFRPAGDQPHHVALIYLHSRAGETPADDPAFTSELVRRGLPCVCPRSEQGWWPWPPSLQTARGDSPLEFVARDVLEWIAATWSVRPPLIGLAGFEMGGQGALQLAYRDARRFPVVAAISPAVDFHKLVGQVSQIDQLFDSAEAARQQTVTLHLHPLNWPTHQMFLCDPADPEWFDGCERLASKLSSIGIPCDCDLETTSGGDVSHYYAQCVPRILEYVARSLESPHSRHHSS
jgi:pimeloyl-ACP methyl ester carboxylesterase